MVPSNLFAPPVAYVAPAKRKASEGAPKVERRPTARAVARDATPIARDGSKKAEVIELMRRSQGATSAQADDQHPVAPTQGIAEFRECLSCDIPCDPDLLGPPALCIGLENVGNVLIAMNVRIHGTFSSLHFPEQIPALSRYPAGFGKTQYIQKWNGLRFD